MKNVFIGYTTSDKKFSEQIATGLKQAGINVWYSPWEIKVGDSIIEKVTKALSKNDYFLIILSPDAIRSEWLKKELNISVIQQLNKQSITILPVLYKQCQLPDIISDLKYANFLTDYYTGFHEILAALGMIDPIPAYLVPSKSVLDYLNDTSIISTLFPFTLSDYPNCLFSQGALDLAIILGSSGRESGSETHLFEKNEINLDILNTKWILKRQVSPGTVRDVVRVVDLVAYLSFHLAKQSNTFSLWPNSVNSCCFMDICVTQKILTRNLILVGGADTNIYVAIASLAFRQKFGFNLPIRYFGEDQQYFTCDSIYSELSGKNYSRLEDSNFMHCGYILMVANPWAKGKVIIFVIGTRGTGTQAALLALCNNTSSTNIEHLSKNNKYFSQIPGKVVRATQAVVSSEPEIITEFMDIDISKNERIPQRHIVTDFEFLE